MPTIATPDAKSSLAKNLNLLSLDAGGPQGISQLMILKNVMDLISHGSGDDSRVAVKPPCEVFDAIGGVGTGGLIAMFLVVLKMTATEALNEFTRLARQVFRDVAEGPKTRTENLKRMIEATLQRHGVDKSATLIPSSEPGPACKLIVPIMYKTNVGVPCVLRNYIAGHEPPTNLTIAEAMLSTCATPPMFTPTSIYKDFGNFKYIGGDVGLSNPAREIIAEAHRAFGDYATVACLLSIGCGYSGVNNSPSNLGVATWIDFLNRVTTDSEKTAREMAARMKHLTLYHRLSVDYGSHSHQSQVWEEPEGIATHATIYLGDLEAIRRVNRCAEILNHRDGFTTLEQLRHSGGIKVPSPSMPQLTPHYVERKEAKKLLEDVLFDQRGVVKSGSKIIVVTGIGGCGKTQLIRKFVEQHGERFVTAFFVDGSSKVAFQSGLVRYVRSLGTANSQKCFDDSMMFLSQPIAGERLLVIDNVDDPAIDLASMLPGWPSGTVIVTSRDISRSQLSPYHLGLDVMSLEESVELLVRGSGSQWPPSESDKEAAITVSKELWCHPIALVQATSYMSTTGNSAETYITRLQCYREPLLNDPATNQVEMRYKTAFAAFDASYAILPPRAQKMLHLLSLFHWQNFYLELVTLAAEDSFSTDYYNYITHGEEFKRGKECLASILCTSSQLCPLELDSLISSLRNHSLITVVSTENATLLQMHPLVHEWSRSRLSSSDLENFRGAAIRLLCCAANEDKHYMMQYLYPHVQSLRSTWNSLHANDALSLAFILHESGLYNEAAELMEKAHELLKAQLGVDHIHTIEALASLARAYRELGRYVEAEELQKEVLRRRRAVLGVNHIETVMATSNLAVTYYQLGRHCDAEELQKEVLQRRWVLLGPNHRSTIRASANLAVTYDQLGRYGEAERLKKEVLEQRQELLGPDHPATIRAAANLAATYRLLGRLADAEELEKDVLRQRRALRGLEHPHTVRASANLAATYRQLGRYSEAEELGGVVLHQRMDLLGKDHPETVMASANLAVTYDRLGRYEEAERLKKEVLQQRQGLLGLEHPATIRASANLAATYRLLGRLADAEELEKDVLQKRRALLGVDHPETIRASANLAVTYRHLGRYAEAEEFGRVVLRQRMKLLGKDHPSTVMASSGLACAYRELGRYGEAEELQTAVLQKTKAQLGADHPATIRASGNLAEIYRKQGRYSKAVEMERDVLKQRTTILGKRHPDTLCGMYQLAQTYEAINQRPEAVELASNAMAMLLETLGEMHPLYLKTSTFLATLIEEIPVRTRLKDRMLHYMRNVLFIITSLWRVTGANFTHVHECI